MIPQAMPQAVEALAGTVDDLKVYLINHALTQLKASVDLLEAIGDHPAKAQAETLVRDELVFFESLGGLDAMEEIELEDAMRALAMSSKVDENGRGSA